MTTAPDNGLSAPTAGWAEDPTVSALLAAWEADLRCPVALADRLRELGRDDLAGPADWAAAYPDRPWYPGDETLAGPSPRPSYFASGGVASWYWFSVIDRAYRRYAYHVPASIDGGLDEHPLSGVFPAGVPRGINFWKFRYALIAFLEVAAAPKLLAELRSMPLP